jgi:CubicO group peptidase (beta-lactamase class C family)
MKTNFFKIVITGAVCGVMLFATACQEKEEFLNEAPGPEATRSAKLGIPTKFDHVKFAQLIEDYLEPQVAGFGYALYNDGVEYYGTNGGDGAARKHIDSPYQAHSANVRQETMQVTQFVTAVAVIRALEQYNVPLTAKAYAYLPKDWKPSAKFKELSFERLLSHRTGLINYNGGLATLRQTVEGPVQETEFSQLIRDDDNVNYDLLALMLPYVQAIKLSQQGNTSMLIKLNSQSNESELFKTTAMYFREFVRFNVFIPAGLSNPYAIAWRAWDSNGDISADKGTKGYPAKTGDVPGLSKLDNNVNPGATGLYLSAAQFAKMQSAVAQFKIISLASIQVMKQQLFGFDGKLTGTKGNYYWKKGDGNNCETMIFDFGKVQVAVFANSRQSEISSPQVLAQFYEQCWIPL